MIQRLTFSEFKEQIAAEGVQLLDVRAAEEFASGTIVGAKLADVRRMDFKERINTMVDLQKPIYLFCHSGIRSLNAARMLESMGAVEIYDLNGGYVSWSQHIEADRTRI